jgi:UDP-2,4-diacetamido-2,4,6-trideoxy-beta-L-altropyranose hydrolase
MKLIIRADASVEIGTGHLMRCLALAQAWQDATGQAIFALATSAPILEQRLQSVGMKVVHLSLRLGSAEDAEETASLARQLDASWIVVDGYHFGAEYQRIIKDSGLHLLFIDDYGHADHYYADIVLNQNIYAHEGLYPHREPYTQLLLGTRYTLLRREFWQWRGWRRSLPLVASKVLVTLGGSDPDNVTLKVIQALQLVETEGLEAVVVVGGSNPHYELLQAAVQDLRFPIRLESNVTNMPELMAWADVAVTAGGSTCWELAFMGLPSLILMLADNQQSSAKKLGGLSGRNLGWHEDVSFGEIAEAVSQLLASAQTRAEMVKRGQELVDGEGSDRVLMQLEGKILRLRPVREDDCNLVWEWANEPEVRAVSFSSEPILWEHHLQWFKSKLINPRCIFYIAINSHDVPIGQVRCDLESDEAVVSISIDRKFRNQGYGSSLIKLASQKLFHNLDVTRLNAYIKPGNQASVKAFVKAGFQDMGTTRLRGHQAIHLVIEIWSLERADARN